MRHTHDQHHHRRFLAGRSGRGDGEIGFGGEGRGGNRGGGRGGHRRGGGRRMFEAGELRLVILHLLEAQPRHGYDFIREVETLTGGAYAPSPGVVYPTLTLLEDLGHIQEARAEGSRRLYSITDEGRAALEAQRTEADAAVARLAAVGVEHRRMDSGPIHRAMHNLKTALQQRLAAEGVDRQTLFDVAAIIDEAAGRIERL